MSGFDFDASMDEISTYLSKNYAGAIVPIKDGYCPKCFSGGSVTVHDLPVLKHCPKPKMLQQKRFIFWRDLFHSKRADPITTINAFVPGVDKSIAHFSRVLLDLSCPGEPCKDRPICLQRCLLCNSLVEEHSPTISTSGDPAFKIHTCCCTRCSYVKDEKGKQVQCKELVPSIPLYIKERPSIMCKEHARLMREGDVQMAPAQEGQGSRASAAQPIESVQPAQSAQPVHWQPAPPKPQKKPATPSRPPKLERDSERGRSHDMKKFLLPAKRAKEQATDQQRSEASAAIAFERPTVVFTPHAHLRHKHKRKVFLEDDDE